MSERIRAAGVCERDIDLLLLEELIASRPFRDWLLEMVGLGSSATDAEPMVRRGVTHSTGESDLEMDVKLRDGRAGRLLIENKVDAALQSRQAERYAERAAEYVANGQCGVAATLVVAPARYLGASDDDMGFDASLTYERVATWFGQSGMAPERLSYKQALLTAATEKATLGYQQVADDAMTMLWDQYGEAVAQVAPELNMPPARGRPSGSHFVFFKPDGMPKRVLLVHKFAYGRVDLEFAGWGERLAVLRGILDPVLPEACDVVRAGKAAAVRRVVRRVSVASAAETRKKDMMDGILAAKQMLAWYRQQSAVMARIVEDAVEPAWVPTGAPTFHRGKANGHVGPR